MSGSHQLTPPDIQETESGSSTESKKRRILYFSSGETLEEDSEEEEEEEEPFTIHRQRYTFKNIAIVVGRISLLTCDFLGKKLAAVLGLDTAKYQYAIDQYHLKHQGRNDQATAASASDEQTQQMIKQTAELQYGTFGSSSCDTEPKKSYNAKQTQRNEGCHNNAYQANGDGVN